MQRRRFLQHTATLALASAGGSPHPGLGSSTATAEELTQNSPEERGITGPDKGPWRRLFLDAAAVEQSENITRNFHSLEQHTDRPVLERDKTWEGTAAITGPYVYGTVLWEQQRLRMWYQILNQGNHVGYAESTDGIHWTKPELGIVQFEGARANNLVVSAFDPNATNGGQCHNPSVVRAPAGSPADARFALFGFDSRRGHARAAWSADGLHWRYTADDETKPLFSSSDVVNFAYDPYRTRYLATWKTRNRRGRAVGVAWSPDGRTWTKPWDGPVFAADDLDPDTTQIYGMPVFPYQGLYVGLPWIYHARYFRFGQYSVAKLHEAQADSPRTMDVQLAWSWDLVNWTRPPDRRPFLARGNRGTWNAGMVVTARAPVVVGDRLFFYYGGTDGVHDDRRVRAAIGLATLRLDGFCSLAAGPTEGSVITRREPLLAPRVQINARTAADGEIRCEILDRRNRPLPGFSRADCVPFRGDAVAHSLCWQLAEIPLDQRRQDYKLRFWLRNASLFSYLPESLDPAQPDFA